MTPREGAALALAGPAFLLAILLPPAGLFAALVVVAAIGILAGGRRPKAVPRHRS